MSSKNLKTSKNVTFTQENVDHALKEINMDDNFVKDIISKEGYSEIEKNINIGKISNFSFLQNKFSCYYNLKRFNEVPQSKQHFITGFGPTNAPTGGTLSMILRAILLERETGIDSTIVISNLGAFNSRNIDLIKISYLTERFIKFVHNLGFKGEVRTHNNFNLLVGSSLTSKVLSVNDFLNNQEVTTNLYKNLGIQGKDFSSFVDANFTVADILLPCILQKKERVLVFVGIEEYYFPKLANLVLLRFNKQYPNQFTPKNAYVSAIFGHLIKGLNGFPKMSKSIPESSINLNDSPKDLERKILKCKDKEEKIIKQMIDLVSDWDVKKIKSANEAFREGGKLWIQVKKNYLEYFLNLKKVWDNTSNSKYKFQFSSLFNQKNEYK